jgi:hypothetical protein
MTVSNRIQNKVDVSCKCWSVSMWLSPINILLVFHKITLIWNHHSGCILISVLPFSNIKNTVFEQYFYKYCITHD